MILVLLLLFVEEGRGEHLMDGGRYEYSLEDHPDKLR